MRKRTENTEEKQPIRLAEVNRLRAALFAAQRMRQMLMPLVTGAVEARTGLMAWSHQLGVEALHEIFRDDVDVLVGPKGKHAPVRYYNRWARHRRNSSSVGAASA